jgi:transposase
MPLLHPPAAGIDVGAEEPWGCVPADRDAQPGQTWSACPWDVQRLADWGTTCRIPTGVMASTGVYGRPRCHLLAARGFAGALVQARPGNQVPGRPQTARGDGRWLHKLPRAGWLAPSVRPPEDLCQLRRLLRPRDPLLQRPVTPMPPLHQALDHLPLPLHHGRREGTGVTGLRRLRALVAGARAARTCAQSRASRLPSRPDTMVQARAGDARPAPGCTRPPSLALDAFPPQHRAACAQDIARVLGTFASVVALAAHPCLPPTTAHRPPPRPAPAFARRAQLSRSTGVARTHVPGCQALTIHTLLSAGGLARSPWPTDPPWASWFGRCPDHRLRGGTGLATGRRRGHHRASRAWRLAAQRRRQRPRARGAFSRRLRRTLGPANATTAPAHQRANMLSHLFQEQTP